MEALELPGLIHRDDANNHAIVSVWAQRDGRAIIWQRLEQGVQVRHERFRPWIYARHLDDLRQLGPRLGPESAPNALITYRELSGPDPAYRYLLSANDGRLLERSLLQGASQRLGRSISSLYELEEDYYLVGPVEQFLMTSGYSYFRGMVFDDLHRLQFDLETTALDPKQGRIFLIALRDNRGFETLLEAPEPEDEASLIVRLCQIIAERDPDVIENHNLFGFDLPFLTARADALGIKLPLGRAGGPRLLERYRDPYARGKEGEQMRYSAPGRELIDTLDAVRRHDFVARDLPSHRLKDVARHFGFASPERTYIAGAEVYQRYREDPESVRRYALDDVREVDALSQRLMGATFALASLTPRRYERLASAGPAMGILEPMLVRAYLQAGAALPWGAGRDQPDTPHAGGGLHLFATGVAHNVVKADIASLYPSLMRSERIGPACDQLGALLAIVDRLTERRLAHKDAMRKAEPGSAEYNFHNAMQAAMKLIINSAYGYMGAGRMALFADRNAADHVTARGRDVLKQVVEALRSRGVGLIEADTDGVYFTVPADWGEARERAFVEEVAATLPSGLRLEYDGRFASMFSHEVKNYVLLTYDQQLILRGVAMRSSRAEPFGERFLREAMLHTLKGDCVALRSCFERYVSDLREQRLAVHDVASRVRLSKSPATYLKTRSSRQEAAYEALLGAGRSEWRVGERVRFYRAHDGRHIWLPDASEESPALADAQAQHDLPPYASEHYVQILVSSYAARLKKAFHPDDFEQLFRLDGQNSLFDKPIESITPILISKP